MKESLVVRQILDWLSAERIFAFRINTAAINIDQRFFRSHSLGAGAADILALWTPAIIQGCLTRATLPIWIECKSDVGKQTSAQKSFQEYVTSLGHAYVVARSIDDVKDLWHERA